MNDGVLPDAVNLAVRAADWYARALQSVIVARDNAERDKRLSEIIGLRKLLRELAAALFDRGALVRAMFETDEYRRLLDEFAEETSATDAEKADKAWREQFSVEKPMRTEYDAVLAAWLAIHVALVPAGGKKPFLGRRIKRFTHLMVDEAQDLSPTHVRILQRLIVKSGTLTFVGDLHQRLGAAGGLRSWDELGIPDLRRAAFAVNHRQSYELGQFVWALHDGLFGEAPVWEPSEERRGGVPRVRVEKAPQRFAGVVAQEVRLWRREIPNATIGVLYDGRWTTGSVNRFKERLEDDLATDSTLSIIHLGRDSRDRHSLKTNCVFIASVASTQGLEFDAVVFIDPLREWGDAEDKLSLRQKHGLYVATSRAQHGLSLVLRAVPRVVQAMADRGLCRVGDRPSGL